MSQILITGANRGLGLEITRQLLNRGDRVIAACRDPGKAFELTKLATTYPRHLKVLPLTLPDERSIAELVRELEMLDIRVDVLINNAGLLVSEERFGQVTFKSLADSFATNTMGAFLLTQVLASRLNAGAKVINVSALLGSIASMTTFSTPSYAITKAALNMATRLLSAALRDQNITVIAVHPGWVQTDMGGVNARLTSTESVQGLLRIINEITLAGSGRFFAYDGKELPW